MQDYISNRGVGGPIDYLEALIKQNISVRGLYFIAPSSGGKTTLTNAFVRTWFCENREEGSAEGCGTCDICTTDNVEDIPNVTRYVVEDTGEELKEAFRELRDKSRSKPFSASENPQHHRRFILVDELEQASKERIRSLLDCVEKAPASTTWIFSSMGLSERWDVNTRDAILYRCTVLNLPPIDQALAAKYMADKTGEDVEVIQAILRFAGGNMRLAWNRLSYFQTICRVDQTPLTPEVVYEALGGGAHPESRLEFWSALQMGDSDAIKSLLDKWIKKSSANEEVIAQLLMDDLVEQISEPNLVIQTMIARLTQWLYHKNYRWPLKALFMEFLGKSLKPIPAKKSESKPASSLPLIFEVKSFRTLRERL
jgi:DNA polymerase III delta prime subunit